MCIKLDLTLTHLQWHSDFSLENKLVIHNFLKHLIPTYLAEWKEYGDKRGNFTCLKLSILIKFLILTWTKQGSFLDFCDISKIFTWTTKIKSCYKLLKLNKGGVFDILNIHFSSTLWVHIQLYMDMVLLFRCISNNEGFSKIIICV